MARHLAVACLVYVALVVQPGIADDLAFGSLRPWMPGVAIVACALCFEAPISLLWAAVVGLGVDCQCVERPGIHVVVATLTAIVLVSMRSDIPRTNVISVVTLAFAASFVWRLVASLAHALLDRHPIVPADFAASACWNGISSAILVLLGMVAWQLMLKAMRPQRRSSISLSNRWSMLTEN